MTWFGYAIFAMLFWGLSNLLDKYIFTTHKIPAMIGWFSGLVGVIVSFIVYGLYGIEYPSIGIAFMCMLSGVLYSGGVLSYIIAIKNDDVSKLVALYNFVPIFIAVLAAIFLGEVFSPAVYIAIAVMVVGALLLSADIDKKIKFTKGFVFIMISVCCFSASNLMDEYLLRYVDVKTLFVLIRFGFFITLIPFLHIFYRDVKKLYASSKKHILFLIGSSTLGIVGFLSFYNALRTGYVTLAESLSALQPLIVLLGAAVLSLFFKDVYAAEIHKDKLVTRILGIIMLIGGSFIVISA
jgi:drug/metabolite transporter (DMT)-like permease